MCAGHLLCVVCFAGAEMCVTLSLTKAEYYVALAELRTRFVAIHLCSLIFPGRAVGCTTRRQQGECHPLCWQDALYHHAQFQTHHNRYPPPPPFPLRMHTHDVRTCCWISDIFSKLTFLTYKQLHVQVHKIRRRFVRTATLWLLFEESIPRNRE